MQNFETSWNYRRPLGYTFHHIAPLYVCLHLRLGIVYPLMDAFLWLLSVCIHYTNYDDYSSLRGYFVIELSLELLV